jgi:SAM-dependent methyltransferase
MSSLILGGTPNLLVLTETDPYYRAALRRRFDGSSSIAVEELTLPDHSAGDRFQRYHLDTVVALNVIEHIAEDVEALRSIASMLRPGGHVVILVPAMPALFGSLDEELGHHRRYTRRSLSERIAAAGFQVKCSFYFNILGMLGWWVNARLRKVPRIPLAQLGYFEKLVPVLRMEDYLPLPCGQSVIAIGARRA